MDERTQEILNRFEVSWSKTEEFINDLIDNYEGFQKLIPVKLFIDQLKQKGEYRFFRLGTSMHTLLISRSVNHGLRIEQKYIWIDAMSENLFEIMFRDGEKTYRRYYVETLEDIRLTNLLKTLKSALID